MTIPNHLRQLLWGLLTMLSLMAPTQAQLAYQDGDLILGVRASGGIGSGSSYEVNLGPALQFTTASGQLTVNLGEVDGHSITEDLVFLFGPDWATRANVHWSVSGVQKSASDDFPKDTIFVTRAEAQVGVQSTPWTRLSTFNGTPALKVQAMGQSGFALGTTANQTQSTASTKALKQTSQAVNSYASFMPGGANTTGVSSFGQFANGGIENTFANGAAGSVVDLYKLEPVSGNPPGVLLGAFRLSADGVLTFSTDITFFQGPTQVKFAGSAIYDISEEGGTVALEIVRTGNTNAAFVVNFSTSNGTAVAGTDYTGQTDTPVSFAIGETSKTVNVTILARPDFQGPRGFSASIALASGTAQVVAPSTATVNIAETSPQPVTLALSAATYTVAEDVNGGILTVTVLRSGDVAPAVTATLSTTDGTALAGTDYTALTNTVVSFATGETSKTVDIAITDRENFQGPRNFTVTLAGPTNGATLGTPTTATVTIQESDPNPAGQIAFSAGTYSFAAADAIAVTLNRTAGTTGAVTVQVALTGGTLDAADLDFSSPATVSFGDGVATQSLVIPLAAGAGPLPGSFNLALQNPTGGVAISGQTTATVNVAAAGVPDLILPKLKVTTPKKGKSAATFNVTGIATDLDAIARVDVRLNGGPVQAATLEPLSGTGRPFSLNGLQAENGKNTLTVQAFDVKGTGSKVTTVTFTYTNIREALAGTYTGLATPTAAAPPAGNAHNASGLLNVTVSKTGTFTGKLLIGGTSVTVGGVIANDGRALFKPAYVDSVTIASKGKAPVTFGSLSLQAALVAPFKITGDLGTVATIDASRAAFSAKAPVAAEYLAEKGKYTVVIPAKDQPVLGNDAFPQGDGYANVTVLKTGKLSLVGMLADGTKITASGLLSANYTVPIYAALYAKKGSFAGVLTLDLTQANSDLSGDDFLWLRPAQPTSKYYVTGWPEGVKLDVFGALYRIPPKSEGKSVFPDLAAVNEATGNATLTISDGNVTGVITEDVNIAPTNKVTNAPATEKTYKVSISAATGKVTGSFTHNVDQSKPALKGIVYQKGPNKGAFGYFLSTVPKGAPAGKGGGFSVKAK